MYKPLTMASTENYGWAEEGGDKALLQLSDKDCLDISNIFSKEETFQKASEYFSFFEKQGNIPKTVKILLKSNKHGDFINYALDAKTCILFRQYHYE